MAKVFNIFSGGKEEKNAKIKHVTPQHQAPSSSRPASAGRRPPPAATPTPVSGIGKSLRIKPPKPPQNTEPDPYHAASREDIIGENLEFKKRIRHLEETISLQKLENQRLDNDANKQQKRIDQLLNLSEGAKSIVLSSDIRKEIEKSILVRQLKGHVSSLRALLVEKDNEIDALRRSIKATHVSEVESERDEYYVETQRLSKIVLEMQDELLREKQRKEWNNKLVGGTGEELRKEVARLASGYQSILSNIAGKGPTARPLSSGGRIGQQLTANLQSSTPDNTNKPKRPQSAVAKSSTHHNTYYTQDNGPLTPTRQQAMAQAKSSALSAPSPFFDDPIDNFGFGGAAAAPAPAVKVGSEAPTAAAAAAVVVPTAPQSNRPSSATTRGAPTAAAIPPAAAAAAPVGPFKVGDKLQGRYSGGTTWYNATVKAAGVSSDGSEPVYHIVYEDGDEEKQVPLGRLRAMESHSTTSSIGGGGSGVSGGSKSKAVYKVGDKVEALYYKGTSYYKATITAVVAIDGGASYQYDLTYDDGDREKKVVEASIRRIGGSAAPSSASPASSEAPVAPAKETKKAVVDATPPPAKFKVGEAVEGLFSGGTNWYSATVKDVKWTSGNGGAQPHYLYELHYADGDRERAVKEDRIRVPQPAAPSAPAEDEIAEELNEPPPPTKKMAVAVVQPVASPVKVAAPAPIAAVAVEAVAKFKKGDKVEGFFQQYDDWFPGVIVSVLSSSSGSSEVCYKVDYDDGDKEDSVIESRLRLKGGTAVVTAAAPVAPSVVAAPSPAATAAVAATGEPEKVDWSKVPLPEGWERKIMAGSGKVVYSNHEKRETQWRHPLDTSKPTGGLFGKKSPSKTELGAAPAAAEVDDGKVSALVAQIRRAIEDHSGASALKDPKAFFERIDRDNEGSVDKRYFSRGLKLARVNLDSDEVDLLFTKFDSQKTGLLTYAAFVDLVNFGLKDATHSAVSDVPPPSSSGGGGGSAVKVTPAPYRRGELVEGKFGGLTQWYPATIEAVNIDANSRDYLFDLTYEDGDSESNIPASNIRPRGFEELEKLLKKLRTKAVEHLGGASAAKAKGKELFGEFDKNGKGSVDKREFKVGLEVLKLKLTSDEVNKLFERFDKNHSGGLEYVEFADLFEFDASEATSGLVTPVKQNGAAASAGGSNSGSMSKTRGKIEIVRQQSNDENDGYTPPESPVVSQSKTAVSTAAAPSATAKSSKFKKGDHVEGFFQQYDDWFPGVIVSVLSSSSGSSEVCYKVDYDDGDKEDSVIESRLRLKGGAVAPVVPVVTAAPAVSHVPKVKAPVRLDSDLDNFLNEISDDDMSLGALDGGRQVDLNATINLSKAIENEDDADYQEDFDA